MWPAELDVHVIVDNNVDAQDGGGEALAASPPSLHAPLHADLLLSWLNLVERWFAALTDEVAAPRHPRLEPDLVDSIRTWISNWNEDPKPFVWHKTADEILDNLANYCERITDSGH